MLAILYASGQNCHHDIYMRYTVTKTLYHTNHRKDSYKHYNTQSYNDVIGIITHNMKEYSGMLV